MKWFQRIVIAAALVGVLARWGVDALLVAIGLCLFVNAQQMEPRP